MPIVCHKPGTNTPYLKRRSKKAKRIYTGIFAGVALIALVGGVYGALTDAEATDVSPAGRQLLSGGGVELIPGLDGKCGTEKDNAGTNTGYSILYILLNVYLFFGIAIICDNQFTASLEMICSEFGLDLNEDVAGATFMAAGSSAPELATSFVGTFLAESNVGVGTIIGSAVFNILVIIGATAMLSSEPLCLDWRPVVRDNFFYLVSVILLICVIKIGGDDDIETVDSIVLLVWYSFYIAYMAINERMIEKFCPIEDEDEDEDEAPGDEEQGNAKAFEHSMGTPTSEANNDAQATAGQDEELPSESSSQPKVPSGTGSGGDEVELENADPSTKYDADASQSGEKKASKPAKKKSGPSLHFAHHQHPSDDKGVYGIEEARAELGADAEGFEISDDSDEEDDEDGVLDKIHDTLAWPWEMLFAYTMPDCFYPFELVESIEDKLKDKYYHLGGFMDQSKWEEEFPDSEKREAHEKEMKAKFNAMSDSDPEKIKMLEHQAQRKKLKTKQLAMNKKDEYKDLSCQQRWFWATFFVSLIHITWMSYFMVEFMTKLGCMWGISDTVMGLTFLAMGTSIPDALGSLAVAEKGEGDMAVSNAVGSNVFDICIGLGLPWFIKCVAGSGPIPIDDTDMVIPSVIILIAIIVLLFSTFAISGWRLINQVGYVLLSAYVAFVIYSLVYESVA